MAHDPAARETVIELLKTAGFAERVPPRRRDRDPEPASGFTAYTETDGSVLVCWVTSAGGYCASYHEVAESLKMAEAYAGACRAAGWTATLGGIIWHHARLTPPGGPLHFPSRPSPGPVQGLRRPALLGVRAPVGPGRGALLPGRHLRVRAPA